MADSSRQDVTPTPTEPPSLPAPPKGDSRVDALPDEFAAFLGGGPSSRRRDRRIAIG